MQLALRDFTSLVRGMKTAVQSAATAPLNVTVGSAIGSILEATGTIGMWFQWLILQVLTQTRLATCAGADVDSWVGDFLLTRLAAVSSVGGITFSRYSATNQAVIPIGALVKTTGAVASFVVTLDTTQASYSATAGGYIIPAGTASLTVPGAAVTPGVAGNIAAGGISLLATAISGVDTVSNALAFTGGINAETDAALKARFALYINSRASGTVAAIQYAATSFQQGVSAYVQENTPYSGMVTVTVDDGSGNPSTALKNQIAAAINLVRPVGVVVVVQGPTVVNAAISIILTLPATAVRATVVSEVSAAVSAYVAGLAVDTTLSYGKLASVVYGADPTVSAGTSILLNSGTADLTAGPTQVVRISSLSVA